MEADSTPLVFNDYTVQEQSILEVTKVHSNPLQKIQIQENFIVHQMVM